MGDANTMESLGFVEGFETPAGRGGVEMGGVRRFFGKYRGAVVNNVDPLGQCRLWIRVTDVYGPNVSTWAMPCVPWAGMQMGSYIVPPLNAGVWVEFEHGDPDYPIWSGCWWGPNTDVMLDTQARSSSPPAQPVFAVATVKRNAVVLTDTPFVPLKSGGVLLCAGPASYIAIEPDGITMMAPKVMINNGALIVTL
jgi:Type VI secretion system/phage-baseplate injector OB domain